MSEQPTNRPGRPAVGPAISVAYPQELLDQVDTAANKKRVSRAAWLRLAAERSLPFDTFDQHDTITPTLDALGAFLDSTREWAVDADAPREEREFRGAAYEECVTTIHEALKVARDTLGVRAANDAYAQAESSDPTETPELGALWGKATGVEMAASILSGLIEALPVDSRRVRERSALNDPQADLG